MVDKRTDITVTPTHKEPYLQGVVFRYSVFAIAFAILTLGIVLLKWWLMVIGLVGFVVGIYGCNYCRVEYNSGNGDR